MTPLRYILVSQAAPPTPGQSLNTHYWWHGPARPATQVATGGCILLSFCPALLHTSLPYPSFSPSPTTAPSELRQLILELYERHLSPDGRAVSYRGIKADPLFRKYVNATAELQRVSNSAVGNRLNLLAPPCHFLSFLLPLNHPNPSPLPPQVDISTLETPELTALFINLYNALIVHALVVLGTEMNALQRAKFFSNCKYNIGGLDYSGEREGGKEGATSLSLSSSHVNTHTTSLILTYPLSLPLLPPSG